MNDVKLAGLQNSIIDNAIVTTSHINYTRNLIIEAVTDGKLTMAEILEQPSVINMMDQVDELLVTIYPAKPGVDDGDQANQDASVDGTQRSPP